MKKLISLSLAIVLCLSLFTAWCTTASAEVQQKNSFTMYSCYVEAEVAGLVELFTKETGIGVNYVRLSAGEMQVRVAAEKENPQVAMIFGMGNDLAMAMMEEDLLDPYQPANIGDMFPEYIDPQGVYVPLHIIVTCFGSNPEWLEENGLEPPTSWDDLLKPEYKGEIVVAHPATSGAAYTVLSQTVQRLGTDAGFEYLKELDKNILVYTKAGAAPFTNAGLGECGVAIGYSDNAQTVIDQGYPLVVSYPEEGTGYGITTAAMVKGGPEDEQEAAHKFIDWLIGESAMNLAYSEFNQYPLNMTVHPEPKMKPIEEIARMNFDAKLSAETKAENCERFEAEVRSSAGVK